MFFRRTNRQCSLEECYLKMLLAGPGASVFNHSELYLSVALKLCSKPSGEEAVGLLREKTWVELDL